MQTELSLSVWAFGLTCLHFVFGYHLLNGFHVVDRQSCSHQIHTVSFKLNPCENQRVLQLNLNILFKEILVLFNYSIHLLNLAHFEKCNLMLNCTDMYIHVFVL